MRPTGRKTNKTNIVSTFRFLEAKYSLHCSKKLGSFRTPLIRFAPRTGERQRLCIPLKDSVKHPEMALAGVSRIEAVFRAHLGDERKILAASDQTDDR
jgi:hypothetical protein